MLSMFCAVLLGACSTSYPVCETTAAAPAAAVGDIATGYGLGAGDRVRVTVFRHPDLSGEFQIDGGGSLALPLVGDIDAAGLNSRQLEQRIGDRLKEESYLVEPRVAVEVLTYRPFYILGEVNRPGEYEYTNNMTVTNAVAVAGGYTYRADSSDMLIRRGDCVVPADVTTKVLPGEVVIVPERFF